MRRAWTMLVTLTCLAAVPTALAAPRASDIAKLKWLEGTWGGTKDGLTSEERWTSPDGDGLVGLHKDVRKGRMVSYEFLRITADSAGVCYVASPPGAPPTTFCATELSDSRVVFENLAHDFPQRILYWRDKGGRLHARVEGTIDGKLQSEEWTWTRRGK